MSWGALVPAASVLLGALLGSMTSLLLYRLQARLAERERSERRTQALRDERKATLLHYFQAARDVERFARQRHAGEPIDHGTLLHATDRLWGADLEVALLCSPSVRDAVYEFTVGLEGCAWEPPPSGVRPHVHLAGRRGAVIAAARRELLDFGLSVQPSGQTTVG